MTKNSVTGLDFSGLRQHLAGQLQTHSLSLPLPSARACPVRSVLFLFQPQRTTYQLVDGLRREEALNVINRATITSRNESEIPKSWQAFNAERA